MSSKNKGAKALALAVSCAVLTGVYGLSPVYAATGTITSGTITSGTITSGTVTGNVSGTVDSSTTSFSGTITNGSITGGTVTGGVSGSVTIEDSAIASALNGQTISGVTSLGVGSITATGASNIGGVSLNNGAVTATSIKTDKLSIGTNAGVITFYGAEGAITASGNIKSTGAEIGKVKITESAIESTETSGSVTVEGVTFKDGAVTEVASLTATGDIKGGSFTTANGTTKLADGSLTIDANNKFDTTNGLTASKATIGNIKIEGSQIKSIAASGALSVGGVGFDDAGHVTNVASIDDVNIAKNTTTGGLKFGGTAEVGGTNVPFSSIGFSVDATGNVSGKSFTTANGTTKLADGSLTIDANNKFDTTNGLTASQATISGSVKVGTANNTELADGSLTIGTGNTWNMTSGITASKAAINGVTIGEDKGKATFGASATDQTVIDGGTVTADEVITEKITLGKNGAKISVESDGDIETQGTLKFLDTENNVVSSINKDGATFGNDSNNQTTIEQGSIIATAKGDNKDAQFKFDADGQLSYANGANGGTYYKQDADGFTSFVREKSGTGLADVVSQSLTKDGFNVKSEATGNSSSFNFNTTDGVATFTNKDGATTTINGNKITVGTAGSQTIIDGDSITTKTLNVDEIVLGSSIKNKNGEVVGDAGNNLVIGADGHISAAGGNFAVAADGEVLNTINGEGDNVLTTFATSNTGAYASFNGKDNVTSKVSVADKSATLQVGDNGVEVTDASATMTYGESSVGVADGFAGMQVGDNGVYVDSEDAGIVYGDNAVVVDDDSVTTTVTGDDNTTYVTTTDSSFSALGEEGNGISVDTVTGATTFSGHSETFANGKQTNTIINGNKITTGSITTDQLIITGQGNADGTSSEFGSIALAGDGSIKSNIKVGDNETTFETDANGVTATVTDGTTTTLDVVAADGTGTQVVKSDNEYSMSGQTADASGTVIKNGDEESSFSQTTTSIGGVVTNGTVEVSQQMDAETGTITNKVVDGDNTSQVVQNKDGLEITNGADGTEYVTKINNNDVSITDKDDTSKRISLSQLGQLDNLDEELSAREEYTANKTAVGAINAEAQVRREEVARLDNRIDDVNDRLDKVGAMSAAIASLKTMGYDPQAPSEFAVGLGQYKGETGVALGFFHYPNKNFMVNVSLSTAGGETMGGIGATWRFGYKSPQKLLDEQRAAQAKKEQAAAEKYRVAAELAKEAQERAEYAAKLARQAQVSADNARAAADKTQAKM